MVWCHSVQGGLDDPRLKLEPNLLATRRIQPNGHADVFDDAAKTEQSNGYLNVVKLIRLRLLGFAGSLDRCERSPGRRAASFEPFFSQLEDKRLRSSYSSFATVLADCHHLTE